ncbi:Clavaminate synthase-like protein [Cryphonectria parasitica EP155]|uniref:Clavaminate synthase-like protein n=1 Tax=Cryphonectria parasitica (strain ATCC 38755 / EP155) TaxID=660469 RepID=A0A9P4YED7_CRYP1|nr:Clavaminate synthase-like protein [Cryphonectria parasitica EP155]KAF3771356.1 Clavaminate synthase-like protein [Cryphonectria parasitica EP155]
MTSTTTVPLRLASGNGPVTRHVLLAPPRDATTEEIPIIDISPVLSPSSSFDARLSVAKQIREAATNTGFFYIRNHGIPSTVTDSAHEACVDFFRQDLETKLQADAKQSAYFNGYKPPQTQRINPFEGLDVRETFSWTYDPRLDPSVGDLASIPEHIRQFLRVEPDGPPGNEDDRFPWSATKSVPCFQPAVVEYWRSCLGLARALVRSFALSLDLDEGYFDDKFSHPDAALALNYYPPLPPSAASAGDDCASATKEVSIGSHTDFQLFTILWQDDAGGLQVLNRQGQWIKATPIPGTFVVNIADYLQRITNDKYQSTVHRAVNHSGHERVSMPFFFGFNLNESCGVLDSCVGADGVKKYDEIGCLEWVKKRVKAMHDTKGA